MKKDWPLKKLHKCNVGGVFIHWFKQSNCQKRFRAFWRVSLFVLPDQWRVIMSCKQKHCGLPIEDVSTRKGKGPAINTPACRASMCHHTGHTAGEGRSDDNHDNNPGSPPRHQRPPGHSQGNYPFGMWCPGKEPWGCARFSSESHKPEAQEAKDWKWCN